MPDVDMLIDRRRLKRRLVLWRALAILAIVAVVVVAVPRTTDHVRGDYIARLDVSGIILDDPERDAALAEFAADRSGKALLVHIDSPGGTVVGGEALFLALRKVAAVKPVVAVLGTMATSAGYMTAIAADHIVSREGTLTGSVGVILQTADVTRLLDKLGISTDAIKSGPLKGAPSPLEPLTPEARKATQAVVDDMFDMFVDMVAQRRGLSRDDTLRIADGRLFTGRQAAAAQLVDQIGGEEEALKWLASVRNIAVGLPIRDVRIRRDFESWFDTVGAAMGKTLFSERLTLDGLVAVWHPALR